MQNKTVNVNHVLGNLNIGDAPEYQVSSAINELLNILASKHFEFKVLNRKPSSDTIIKIKHNHIESKGHIIKQYLDYSSKIEEAYTEIDSMVVFGKDTILRNLNDLYYSALDAAQIQHIVSDIDIEKVRENSEFILDFIIQKLKNTVFESKNTPLIKEHIDRGVNVVVAHAFIECIIMENPEDDT